MYSTRFAVFVSFCIAILRFAFLKECVLFVEEKYEGVVALLCCDKEDYAGQTQGLNILPALEIIAMKTSMCRKVSVAIY